jgi:hypothetical protein
VNGVTGLLILDLDDEKIRVEEIESLKLSDRGILKFRFNNS